MATNAVWKHLYGKTKHSAFLLTTQSAGRKARAQRQIRLVGRSPPAVSALTTKSGLPPSLGPSICCPISSSFVASLVTVLCLCTRAWMCCRQARLASDTFCSVCISYGCSEKVWRWGWVPQPTGGEWGASQWHITCHQSALWITNHAMVHGTMYHAMVRGGTRLLLMASFEQVSKRSLPGAS